MSCILRISGEDLDADAFKEQSGISLYSVFRKGEPKYKSKPESLKLNSSGCMIEVSNANFNEFNQQVADAILYLKTNRLSLTYISQTNEVEHAFLDFGVNFNPTNDFVQSQYFPLELIMLAADLGIGINLSMYQPSEEE
jgi:hypothetical protein